MPLGVYVPMTWEDLKTYIGETTNDNNARIGAAWDMATELMTKATALAWRPMPDNVFDECCLKVGKNWYDSKNTTGGGTQYGFPEGTVIARGPRDPLSEVRPIINTYVVRY